MDKISELLSFSQTVIMLGGVVRIMQCSIALAINNDESSGYSKKIKNLIGFMIISVSILEIVKLAMYYLSI